MTQVKIARSTRKTHSAKITYDEFLKRYMDSEHVEWVNGKVVPMSPVTKLHEDERGFLYTIIREYALTKQLGEVSGEPYNMKIGHRLPGRAPDILFVAKANLARMYNEYLDGPADLIVEVISPESRRRDRVTKFGEYEQGGVREFWLLDPQRQEWNFYLRDANGKFQPVAIGNDGIYRSTVLDGFWLKIEWLWQTPKPTLVEVLRTWGML
jgi:Uma2 family endonuclease